MKSLHASVRAAEPIIEDASESRRINPRRHWQKHDAQQDFDDLDVLSVLGRHTLDLGETISSAIWSDPVPVELPEDLREPLSAALARTADLVLAWNDRAGTADAMREAEASLEMLGDLERNLLPAEPAYAVLSAIIFTLRRMLSVIHARIDPPSA